MARRDARSFQVYVAALVAAGALSFAPLGALGWVNDLASVVKLPTVPLGDLLKRVESFLRRSEIERDDSPQVAALQQEVDRFRTLFNAERERAEALLDRVEQLERTKELDTGAPFDALSAAIVGRNTQSRGELFDLNRGSGRRVVAGAAVVYNGSHLIGRIGHVGPMTSILIPITDAGIGSVEGYASPASAADPRNAISPRPHTLLAPTEDGDLAGDIAREAQVRVGDLILLADPSWPRPAMSRIVGEVVAVQPKDDNMLREEIVVRPRYRAADLASVTILVEASGAEGDGE